MKTKNMLTMGDTVTVGNWLTSHEPLVGPRSRLVELIEADTGIMVSVSSITTLCSDLGLTVKSPTVSKRGLVSRKDFMVLVNEIRMLTQELGEPTSSEFSQLVSKLFHETSEENK